MVVTNTFHGTILSIITERPMAVISQQPKIVSIMNNLGLSERNMTNINKLESVLEKTLDFSDINVRLNRLRSISESYLDKALSDLCDES